MPELLRKRLLPPGAYVAPQGTYVASPNRMRKQVEKFKKLKAEGYKIPVPWGHRLSAIPQRETVSEAEFHKALEQRAFEEARYNASYVEDLDLDKDGALIISLPVPPGYKLDRESGDIINEADGTRIREVSGAFGDWQDGKGRLHRDILIHAALCVRPVDGQNQPGFASVTGSPAVTLATWHTLSTGAVRYTQLGTKGDSSMAKEDDIEVDDTIDDLPDGDEEETETVDETPAAPTPEPEPVKVKQPDMFETCVALLNQLGVQMPAHAKEENGWETLATVLTTAIGMGAKVEPISSDDDAAATPPMPQATSDQPPQPEAPPVMMATMTDTELAKHGLQRIKPTFLSTEQMTDREKVWAGKQQKDVQRKIRNIYRQLRDKFGLFPDFCERKIAKASMVQLSMLPNGEYLPPPSLEAALDLLEVISRQHGITDNITRIKTLATAQVAGQKPVAVPNPVHAKPNKGGDFAQKMLEKSHPGAVLAEVR